MLSLLPGHLLELSYSIRRLLELSVVIFVQLHMRCEFVEVVVALNRKLFDSVNV